MECFEEISFPYHREGSKGGSTRPLCHALLVVAASPTTPAPPPPTRPASCSIKPICRGRCIIGSDHQRGVCPNDVARFGEAQMFVGTVPPAPFGARLLRRALRLRPPLRALGAPAAGRSEAQPVRGARVRQAPVREGRVQGALLHAPPSQPYRQAPCHTLSVTITRRLGECRAGAGDSYG